MDAFLLVKNSVEEFCFEMLSVPAAAWELVALAFRWRWGGGIREEAGEEGGSRC